jgi:mono/diheme cytochrome c family protein
MSPSPPSAPRTVMRWAVTALVAMAAMNATVSSAQQEPQGPLLPRDSADAAAFRGGLVYANYCVTCHGMNADGNGRAARLYTPRPANLRGSSRADTYLELIVRFGGEFLGRSPKMPPWGEELTDEQIRDVVSFIRSVNGTRQ